MAYCNYSYAQDRFERLPDYLPQGTDGGTTQFNRMAESVSQLMNAKLGERYWVPIGTTNAGTYDEILQEICASETIFLATRRRHAGEGDTLPQWIQDFGSFYNEKLNDLVQAKITLSQEITRAELGVNPPITGTGNTGKASLYTNSGLTPFGEVYQGEYAKTFVVQIDGTAGTNAINQCTFKVSDDDGINFQVPKTPCGTSWIGLWDGVHIRWAGTSREALGTFHQLDYGDSWRFNCIPMTSAVESGDFANPVELQRF